MLPHFSGAAVPSRIAAALALKIQLFLITASTTAAIMTKIPPMIRIFITRASCAAFA
jgi:hypothetical protein